MDLVSDLSSLVASDTTMVLLIADPDLTGFSSILKIVKVSVYPLKSTFWLEAPKCTEFNYCLKLVCPKVVIRYKVTGEI